MVSDDKMLLKYEYIYNHTTAGRFCRTRHTIKNFLLFFPYEKLYKMVFESRPCFTKQDSYLCQIKF